MNASPLSGPKSGPSRVKFRVKSSGESVWPRERSQYRGQGIVGRDSFKSLFAAYLSEKTKAPLTVCSSTSSLSFHLMQSGAAW